MAETKAKRPYGGRKPKSDTVKTSVITIRVTEEEKNKIKMKAEEKGLKISEYLLSLIQ